MTIGSFEVVLYTCVFLLPGFIIRSILDSLVPPSRHNEAKYFLSCLLYSIVNCSIWSWAYLLLIQNVEKDLVHYLIGLLIITIVGAAIVGVIIGLIKQKDLVKWIFSKFGVEKIHSTPAAWDYYFSKQEETWIIVTLKSGKIIYGKYSNKSFASSDPEERDLYIEQTYSVTDDLQWVEDKKSKGILISKEEIETIEFFE